MNAQLRHAVSALWQRRKTVLVLFWIGFVVLATLVMHSAQISFQQVTSSLTELLTAYPYSPLIFIALYALRPLTPLIVFPAALFTMLAGNLYGFGTGLIFALIGGTLSALIPYQFGRWLAGEGQFDGDRYPRFQRVIGFARRNTFQAVFMVRLLHLPYDLSNFVLGGFRLMLVPFIAATALGNIIGALPYTGIGVALQSDMETGGLTIDAAMIAFSVAVFVISLVVTALLRLQVSQRPEHVLQDRHDHQTPQD